MQFFLYIIAFVNQFKIFLHNIVRSARKNNAKGIGIVFDSDKEECIKHIEISSRGEPCISGLFTVLGVRIVPKFKDFMKSVFNKRSQLIFFTNYIFENCSQILKEDEKIIIGGGFENVEKAVILTKSKGVQTLHDLNSTQEEADTRIILHPLYESIYSNKILIKSINIDIFILLLHSYNIMPALSKCDVFMTLSHGLTTRLVNLKTISEICTNLLAIHTLTRC